MGVDIPERIGPYTVVDRFAVGGMAELFLAKDASTQVSVAIKRMLPHIAEANDGPAQFKEEARLGALVCHPNVVRLLGAGEFEGAPYLVLEYVHGCDLWRLARFVRREQKPLPVPVTIYIVRQLLTALSATHQIRDTDGNFISVIHRDVSPSNVLLSVDGEVKLGDFGIARAGDQQVEPRNRAKGKLGYLSPEQVLGRTPDQRSDVYAAGVVAAELLLGRELFSGGSELAILLSIRDGNIRAFEELDIDASLKSVICSALEADREARTQDAETFSRALAPFAGDEELASRRLAETVARVIGLGQAPTAGAPPSTTMDSLELMEQRGDERTTYPGVPPLPRTIGKLDFDSDSPDVSDALDRTTGNLPIVSYVVVEAGRRRELTFARLVEELTTGALTRDARVSVDGGEAAPISTIPHLARHLPMVTRTGGSADAPMARDPDRRAGFRGGGFVHRLAETIARRETGLWLCEHESIRKELYLKDGVPQFVGSNLAGELLGEFLVQRGVISRTDLDMALAVLPRFDGRLGETLIRLQLVEAVSLFREIEVQVRTKVLDLFLWDRGTAQFFLGVSAPPLRFPLQINAWKLLSEGISERLQKGLETERFREKMMAEVSRVPQLPSHLELTELPDELLELFAFLKEPKLLPVIADRYATEAEPRRGYRLVLTGLHIDLIRWS